ncbi:MAG: CHRD domain-containing protein [Casimicrobium sp.]
MKLNQKNSTRWIVLASLLVASAVGLSAQAAMPDMLKLTGEQEVPPVKTLASGSGMLAVAADGAISGNITTEGLKATMAHVHMGALGANGPVIITLVKTTDTVWSVPQNAKLSAEQLAGYRAGRLYVNVHTEANKGGEIRAQLTP